MAKKFFTYEQQLSKLQQEKALIIPDTNAAKLINNVLKQCPHLTREQLLKEMGFPENWEKIMRYKK